MDDLQQPCYYIVNRTLELDQVGTILNAIRITPVLCAVISTLQDSALAFALAADVVRVANDTEAVEFAMSAWQDSNLPSLILGTAVGLDQVYADGRKETLC